MVGIIISKNKFCLITGFENYITVIKYLKLLLDISVRLFILFIEFWLVFIVYARFYCNNSFLNILLLSLLVILGTINSTAVYFLWVRFIRSKFTDD